MLLPGRLAAIAPDSHPKLSLDLADPAVCHARNACPSAAIASIAA